MKVLLADDHGLFRHGLALALSEIYGDGVTVLEAGGADQALRLAREEGKPDLALVDLRMPGFEGFEDLRRFVAQLAPAPVVVVSGSDNAGDIQSAIDCGARGYILKSANFDILRHVLPLVLAGGTYVPADIMPSGPHRRAETVGGKRVALPDEGPLPRLTQRQREVLVLILQGQSNKEIARVLGMVEGTVKIHVRAILRTLGVKNRTQAAMLVARLREGSGFGASDRL